MTQTYETYEGMVVPEPVLVKVERADKHGRVPGLQDEELADPDELERQALREEFEPILLLPKPTRGFPDESELDWSAFGTVDFARTRPARDRAREKADELREQLKNKLIILAIVKERLPRAATLVLKYLRMGIIDLGHITNVEMLAAARLFLQARSLQRELWRVDNAARKRKERACERWLEALG
ncbi:MAG: hypothetical protein ISS72_10940 [Candidatus Brocadiae bacterium]|nr:hypothetical protein [Candidatus Brocadiia bacterium]